MRGGLLRCCAFLSAVSGLKIVVSEVDFISPPLLFPFVFSSFSLFFAAQGQGFCLSEAHSAPELQPGSTCEGSELF